MKEAVPIVPVLQMSLYLVLIEEPSLCESSGVSLELFVVTEPCHIVLSGYTN